MLSKRRKTVDYIKDNVFDTIDIESALRENKRIPKIDPKAFVYIDQLSKSKNRRQPLKALSSPKAFDDNKFYIKLDELFIEYRNGYKEPFDTKYQVIDLLGEGSFGLVLSIIERDTNQKMAVKIIQKQKSLKVIQNPKNEAQILNRLSHRRIVRIYEVIDTDDYLFIFMDLIKGCSLKEMIIQRYVNKKGFLFSDYECSVIIKGILEGIGYIHSKNIVHRDLKPENIMFRDNNDLDSLVICDFGVSEEFTEMTPEKCGTTLYMTPEMMLERKCDQLIDVWATGIILYVISSGGKHPIYSYPMTSKGYVDSLLLRNDWTFPPHFPILARNLFLKLCKYEPIYRYTSNKALSHPWITRSTQSVIPLTIADTYEQKNKIEVFKTMLTALVFLKSLKDSNEKPSDSNSVRFRLHLSFSTTMDSPEKLSRSPFSKKRTTHLKLKSLMLSPTFKIHYNVNNSNTKQYSANKEGKKSTKGKKAKRCLLSSLPQSPNRKEPKSVFPPLVQSSKPAQPMKLTIRKTISCGFIIDHNGFQTKKTFKTPKSIWLKNALK